MWTVDCCREVGRRQDQAVKSTSSARRFAPAAPSGAIRLCWPDSAAQNRSERDSMRALSLMYSSTPGTPLERMER